MWNPGRGENPGHHFAYLCSGVVALYAPLPLTHPSGLQTTNLKGLGPADVNFSSPLELQVRTHSFILY